VCYGLDDRASIRGKSIKFSLLHCVKVESGGQPASYPMGACRSLTGDKNVISTNIIDPIHWENPMSLMHMEMALEYPASFGA
jgi:hypothetical protein